MDGATGFGVRARGSAAMRLCALAAVLVVATTGCRTLGKTAVPSELDWVDPTDVPSVKELAGPHSGGATAEAGLAMTLSEVQRYCAEVVQHHHLRTSRLRNYKNLFAAIGVISGAIIAPSVASGSAIRAWAGVSGASAGALSTLFDSAAPPPDVGNPPTSLPQYLWTQSTAFLDSKKSYPERVALVSNMLLACRMADIRVQCAYAPDADDACNAAGKKPVKENEKPSEGNGQSGEKKGKPGEEQGTDATRARPDADPDRSGAAAPAGGSA